MLHIENLIVARGIESQQFQVSLPRLQLADGEVISLQGKSGCGKSTILEAIGLILQPCRLDCLRIGRDDELVELAALVETQNQAALAKVRSKCLGFMLQTGGLLPFLNVQQNIDLPCKMLNLSPDFVWREYLVERLGVGHLLNKLPNQLSIGERQRVAFIRAIIHKPSLLLADEPTAALDPINAQILFELIIELAKSQNISTILVTHDWELSQRNGISCLRANCSHQSDESAVKFNTVFSDFTSTSSFELGGEND